jgi:hypothetical protein
MSVCVQFSKVTQDMHDTVKKINTKLLLALAF